MSFARAMIKRLGALALVAAALTAAGCNEPLLPITTDAPTETPAVETPAATPENTPSATVEATPEPTPTPTPLDYELYHVKAHNLNVRSSPSLDEDNIIGELHAYDRVKLVDFEDDVFAAILLESGELAYCAREFLLPIDVMFYAHIAPFEAQKTDIVTGEPVTDEEGNPVMVKCELVDLRYFFPDAEYELLFATSRNVTGAPLYPYAIPMLQLDTVMKLKRAVEAFAADGYTIKFYDAYRPLSVQRKLFDIVQVPKWIANPDTTASNHNRGCAVDISLIGPDGVELEFPTPMHTFSEDSARDSDTWSETARANVDYMTGIMERYGFQPITSEWWHFADSARSEFMTMDILFNRFTFVTAEEMERYYG
ncbi:MAG: M15 family metallopeptidase [Clostridia bacterium]|nr:M15 family metallopeptidase [Clostridia bacterium]